MAYVTYFNPHYIGGTTITPITYTTIATTTFNPNTTYYAYIDVPPNPTPFHIPFRESLRLDKFKFTDWKKSFK